VLEKERGTKEELEPQPGGGRQESEDEVNRSGEGCSAAGDAGAG